MGAEAFAILSVAVVIYPLFESAKLFVCVALRIQAAQEARHIVFPEAEGGGAEGEKCHDEAAHSVLVFFFFISYNCSAASPFYSAPLVIVS